MSIPSQMIFSSLLIGRSPHSRSLFGDAKWGREDESTIYQSPLVSGLATLLSSAILGIAESAFDASRKLLLGQADK